MFIENKIYVYLVLLDPHNGMGFRACETDPPLVENKL